LLNHIQNENLTTDVNKYQCVQNNEITSCNCIC